MYPLRCATIGGAMYVIITADGGNEKVTISVKDHIDIVSIINLCSDLYNNEDGTSSSLIDFILQVLNLLSITYGLYSDNYINVKLIEL